MLIESKGTRYNNCSIKFKYNNEDLEFKSDNTKNLFKSVVDWLYKSGYEFKGSIHSGSTTKLLSEKEVDDIVSKTSFEKRMFYNILGTGNYIAFNSKVKQLYGFLSNMLINFGVKSDTIETHFESDESEVDKIKPFKDFVSTVQTGEDIDDEVKVFKPNPFRQAICVLGESGAGKSTTIRHILEFEGHEFDLIIPSASTTGLLSQFSPSRSGYIQSRLGKLIVAAFNNPTTLYTAIVDECHKSNLIEMINDELLQAISTKRNMGRRFISLDDDTSELYKGVEFDKGNILIPDNFGFIFISSKPRIISNNTDFFNRVDLVVLTEADRDIKTSEELLSKVLPDEEKMKLASTRND